MEIAWLEAEPTGQVNEEVEVHVRTAGYNGCWSNLEVQLIKDESRHFSLKAKGIFSENAGGGCPENAVLEDTIIRFTPADPGAYYLKANRSPLTILHDTVEVQ